MSASQVATDRGNGRPPKGLGELLLQADLITERQLREALSAQRRLHERLASVLVRQGVLTEKFAVGYLGKQLGVPAACLSRQTLDLGLLQLIPLALCERHTLFPLRIEGGRLLVAMKDPLDAKCVSEIERMRSVRLSPSVALEVTLRQAIKDAHEALATGRSTLTPDVQRALELLPPPASADAGVRGPIVFPLKAGEAPARHGPLASAPVVNSDVNAPAAAASHAAAGERVVLLVHADGPERWGLERTILEAPDRRVVNAGSAREAMSLAGEAHLVLVDGALPDAHPLELCRSLRSRWPSLPVILLSPRHSDWRLASDAANAFGLTDCLDKRVAARELLLRVEAALGHAAPVSPAVAAAKRQLQEGMTALLREALHEAQAHFQRGVAEDPANDLLHYYAGMTFEKQGRPFEAIDHHEAAVRLNPQFEDALVRLAGLYERVGFRLKAVETWQRALAAARDERSREKLTAHVVALLRAALSARVPSRAA